MQAGYKSLNHSGINTRPFLLPGTRNWIQSGDILSFDYGNSSDPITNEKTGILSPNIIVLGIKDKNLVGISISYLIHQIPFNLEGKKTILGKSALGVIYDAWLNHFIDFSKEYQKDGNGLKLKPGVNLLPKRFSYIFGKYDKILSSLVRYYFVDKIRNTNNFRKSQMVMGRVFNNSSELIIPLDMFIESTKGFVKRGILPRV